MVPGSKLAPVAARCKRHTRDVKIRNYIPYLCYIRPTLMCFCSQKLFINKQTRGFNMITSITNAAACC